MKKSVSSDIQTQLSGLKNKAQLSFLTHFKVFGDLMKHCLCLIQLLKLIVKCGENERIKLPNLCNLRQDMKISFTAVISSVFSLLMSLRKIIIYIKCLCSISDFFTSLDLSHLVAVLKTSLQIMVEVIEKSPQAIDILNGINSSFQKLVEISGALYCISDLIHIPIDLCQFLIFLVSIPWLSTSDHSWNDLPHKFGLTVDAMTRVGMKMGPVIDKESMDLCLHLLAVFPSDAAPTWRSQVFLLVLVMITSHLSYYNSSS